MPESCSICGEPMLPAHRITSRAARTVTMPRSVHTSTPVQREVPSGLCSISSRETCADVHRVKLRRPWQVGRRNALAVFQRQPFFWLTSK
jgi:hypothetical protein